MITWCFVYSWNIKYRNVYTGAGVQIPMYLVLGNHDYGNTLTVPYTSAQAQIQMTFDPIYNADKRWNMPDHNFTMTYEVPQSGGKHLQIVYIDSCRICPSETKGSSTYSGLSAAQQATLTTQHLAWLSQTLAASTATWIFVVGHYQCK